MNWSFPYIKDGKEYLIDANFCLCEECAKKLISELGLEGKYVLGEPNKGICNFNYKHGGNIITLVKLPNLDTILSKINKKNLHEEVDYGRIGNEY